MRNRLILVSTLLILIFVGLYVFNPTDANYLLKCVFKQTTGLSCPSCGIQRFLHAMLHGRFIEAINYNYFLLLSLPYAFLLILEWILPHGKIKSQIRHYSHHQYAVWAYVIGFCLWFIIRNIFNL